MAATILSHEVHLDEWISAARLPSGWDSEGHPNGRWGGVLRAPSHTRTGRRIVVIRASYEREEGSIFPEEG